ncbi:hypothetical protein Metli_0794 [Methanofollis liminatans DSM 4140]|uniref:Uncharacterized protein n=1 Tax=Methanofollis liminatans DSM 4140 TaxID=28892 RepID=J1L257_9EURY|nr:hypothetical protein Metli_0794 [Methanofollis liminatans DSM 4140]
MPPEACSTEETPMLNAFDAPGARGTWRAMVEGITLWIGLPGAGAALCQRTRNRILPVSGGWPARKTAIGAGTGKPRRHVHPSFFIERGSDLPFPQIQGNRMRGSGGKSPRAEADFAIRSIVSSYLESKSSGKPSSLPREASRPPIPLHMRLGQGWAHHASRTIKIFFIDRCSAWPFPAFQEQSSRGGLGVQPPARGGICVTVWEIRFGPCRGASRPRPPRTCDWCGDGQTSPACPSRFFYR